MRPWLTALLMMGLACSPAGGRLADVESPPTTCLPQCEGRACGSDGCGGLCGICPMGLICNGVACVPPPCEASCDNKACGDDGCGGSCGECGAGESCNNGGCFPLGCLADCLGRTCGEDGCGGSCGSCEPEWECQEGRCLPPCMKEDSCGPPVGGLCYDDSECDSEICFPPFCSRVCADDTDCLLTDPGPVGTSYHCLTGSWGGYCWPGSLKSCALRQDCNPGEVCGLVAHEGEPSGRCMTAIDEAPAPGQACGANPVPCAVPGLLDDEGYHYPSCYDGVCLETCIADEDCSFAGAQCLEGACVGGVCSSQDDCGGYGASWACAGATLNAEGELQPTCLPLNVSGAGLGEECNDDPCDEVPDNPCAAGICLDMGGRSACTVFCGDHPDCGAGEVCMDVQFMEPCEDGVCSRGSCCEDESCEGQTGGFCCLDGDPTRPVISGHHGLCLSGYEGTSSRARCEREADCPTGESCMPIVLGGRVQGVCMAGEGGGLGDECDNQTRRCRSELCLGGVCSTLCTTSQDCPCDYSCSLFYLSFGDDGEAGTADDLTAGGCMADFSAQCHEPCLFDGDPTTPVCPPGTVCQGLPLPFASAMEAVCTDPFGAMPIGSPCQSDLGCTSGWCLRSGSESQGYCTAPCGHDEDCAPSSLSCRALADPEGLIFGFALGEDIRICADPDPCGACLDDRMCGEEGDRCAWLLGSGLGVCGGACETNEDCTTAELPGLVCATESLGALDREGNALAGQCLPAGGSCP